MTYEEAILNIVKLQETIALHSTTEMYVSIRPFYTRVDLRNKNNNSVKTIVMEHVCNFEDKLKTIRRELSL